MSKFNLAKAVEKTQFVIAKKNLAPNLRAHVLLDLDVSGSAQGLFQSGQMQSAFERILPLGIAFDDNKEIDVYTFADGSSIAHVEPNATTENYSDYVQKSILNNRDVPKWGGTDYAPVLKKNLEDLGFYEGNLFGFGSKKLKQKSKSGYPAVVYFLTDGANSDRRQTTELLRECQKANSEVYFLFIGIGRADFSYLEQIGDEFGNTGFLNVADMHKFEDDESVYDLLLPDELVTWLKTSR